MVTTSAEPRLTAVVIGSGFAGLSAAAGLSKLFDRVVLLDKDDFQHNLSAQADTDPSIWRQEYEAEVKRRQGVSQYRQPHAMLVKGLQELEALFPSYTSRLLAAGAIPVDGVKDLSLHDWGLHWEPGHESGLKTVCASRHTYENVARSFVLNISNVTIQTNAAVKGLLYDAVSAQVTGVQLKDGQSIAADLVVDASGGNSRVNKWLEQIGYPTPPSMVVDAGLQYTCRMYEMTGDPKSSTNLIMIMDHPEINRMAVRLPIEHNKWQVVLVGYKGHHCPSDEAGFMEFARKLPAPHIYDSIVNAKPLSSICPYTQTANIRRRFELVPPPAGLCVIGDACCRFNPIFGQGMSVSVMGSALLCKCTREVLAAAGPTKQQQLAALKALPVKFHSQLGSVLEFPWSISSGTDAKKPNAKVDVPKQPYNPLSGLLTAYFNLLQQARFKDAYIFNRTAAVQHMVATPAILLQPGVIGRLLLYWLRSTLHL